jgi:hypothetical protein
MIFLGDLGKVTFLPTASVMVVCSDVDVGPVLSLHPEDIKNVVIIKMKIV